MSKQDSEVCAKCGKPCGYDDEKVSWGGFILCRQCKGNLIRKFCAFFGVGGIAGTTAGLEVEWQDVDRIMSSVKRDYNMRVSYLVTDKQFYEKEKTFLSPIIED